MCGIVGIVAFHKKNYPERSKFLYQSLYVSALRGTDGTGIFCVPHTDDKKDIVVYKKPIPSFDFLQLKPTEEILKNSEYFKYFVGHARAKTSGVSTINNTHPFTHGHITLVHNGSAYGLYDLVDKKSFDVDSETIAYALSLHPPEKVIENLTGAFTLVWYDAKEDSLNIVRNDERPLSFKVDEKNELFLFASEQEMLELICARNGIEGKTYTLKPGFLITFKDSIKYSAKEVKLKEKTVAAIGYDSYGNWNNYHRSSNNNSRSIEGNKVETVVWTSHGASANTKLSPVGLKAGEEVTFTFTAYKVKSNRSRHGSLQGTMVNKPWWHVAADGGVIVNYEVAQRLVGKITGVMTEGLKTTLLIDSTSIKVAPEPTLITNISDEDYKEYIDGPDYTDTEVAAFNGPARSKITLSQFTKLVSDGCCFCSGPIRPEDHDKIVWTHDNQPLCIQCWPEHGARYYDS